MSWKVQHRRGHHLQLVIFSLRELTHSACSNSLLLRTVKSSPVHIDLLHSHCWNLTSVHSPVPNMSTPSIQSFFRKTSSVDSGFTTAELSTSNPLSRAWDPPSDTGYVTIANIVQGKGNVYFKGRIINFRPAVFDRHSAQYLKAWHYLVVKDDSGAIGVSSAKPFCL